MKVFKTIAILFFVFTLNISCKNDTPVYEKMEFHIKGMTCEIGCARLIESKLSKTKGIKFTKVIFKDSIGLVEYDTNMLDKQDVFKVVEKIADGTLYKVTDNKMVNEFSLKK